MILVGANAAYLKATDTTADAILGKHIFETLAADPPDPDRYAVPRNSSQGITITERK